MYGAASASTASGGFDAVGGMQVHTDRLTNALGARGVLLADPVEALWPAGVTDRSLPRLMVRDGIEGGPAMITRERARLETPPTIVLPRRQESAPPVPREAVQVSAADIRRFLRRLALAFVGFGIAMLGFSLMLTVFLVFIGLPLFILGVAIMQAQES